MHFQKFISMMLAVALTLSMCVVAVPSALANEEETSNLVIWFLDVVRDNLDQAYQFVRQVSANYVFSSGVNHVTPSALQQACNDYRSNFFNNLIVSIDDETRGMAIWDGLVDGYDFCYICLDEDTNRVRLRNRKFGYWIVNDLGEYPWCTVEEWNAATKGNAPVASFDPSVGKWVSHSFLQSFDNKIRCAIISVDELKYLASEVQKKGWNHVALSNVIIDGVGYLCIRRQYENTEGDEFDMVWCNSNGCPYVVIIDLDKTASQNPTTNNYTEVTNKTENSPTYNQTTIINNNTTTNPGPDYSGILLDINNGVLNLIDELGNLNPQQIYDVTYDYSDHSYHVTTYNQTFNQTDNYYSFNYNTYNIQYTYNNTYITYIGSTAEYQPKEWELYYELPDGRSSADLTEEDVAGLSFQFNDCINYKKSATDTALRALYHFDGNTDDSSYFSNQGSFTWNTGASITYMEANAFNGTLYLDEKEHEFTISLPRYISTDDFTLQWRYYQNSATTTDHNENYVKVGGIKLMGWSEQTIYDGSGKNPVGLSVGSWQELAIVRHNGTVYLYHNGVMIGSSSLSRALNSNIVFHFGGNSRAYSMIDELRFVQGALYINGQSYTPTAVPYDSNQVLVLPGNGSEVMDSYWSIDDTIKPTFSFDFFSGNVYSLPLGDCNRSSSSIFYYSSNGVGIAPSLRMPPSEYAELTDSGLSLRKGANSLYYPTFLNNRETSMLYQWQPAYATKVDATHSPYPLFELSYSASSFSKPSSGQFLSGQYTVTVLYSNGQSKSGTVTLKSSSGQAGSLNLGVTGQPLMVYFYNLSASDSNIAGDDTRSCYSQLLCLLGTCDIAYLEIVPGAQANSHEFMTAVYDVTDLQPNTAAIQTDIPINGYTVGGVRPTFPQRGDVWFPVEGSRISGVQVYNGQAWEETNARWWTGSRWIPIYAFDLVTLADMWDVTSSVGSDVEVTPPITSETGFWNWWKNQWLDFRAWLEKNLGNGGSGGVVLFPSVEGECEHNYTEKILTAPTCTQKGTALYTCSKCGDSYRDTLDAAGHDWVMKDSVPDELDEDDNVTVAGYDLYVCSVCGEEYKDYARTGPPGSEEGSSLTQLIQQLFDSLGNLVGSLVDWVLDLAKDAIDGFGSLGEYFNEKAEEVKGFGGEFVEFFGAFFGFIPSEIMTCISLALVLFGIGLFIRKVFFE